MRRIHRVGILASIILGVIVSGCTDPTRPPVLLGLLPNPVDPQPTPQNLDFLGSNLDRDVYFIIETENETDLETSLKI